MRRREALEHISIIPATAVIVAAVHYVACLRKLYLQLVLDYVAGAVLPIDYYNYLMFSE